MGNIKKNQFWQDAAKKGGRGEEGKRRREEKNWFLMNAKR